MVKVIIADENGKLPDSRVPSRLSDSNLKSQYLKYGVADVQLVYGITTGSTDVRVALNAALADCAANGVSELKLRPGTYTVSTGHLIIPQGVHLSGVRRSNTKDGTGAGTVIDFANSSFAIVSEGKVSDLTIIRAGYLTLDDAVSRIGLLGGQTDNVSTDKNTKLFPTRNLHNYLGNTVTRLNDSRSFGPMKFIVMGDSLAEGAYGTIWADLLFVSSHSSSYFLGNHFAYQPSSTGQNNGDYDNIAVGGSTAHLMASHFAHTRQSLELASGGGYINQQVEGENLSVPPILGRGYDLAIVCVGQNQGGHWKVFFERSIRRLRDAGIDVIIVTQNPAAGTPSSRQGDLLFYREIASVYGCALADTYTQFLVESILGRYTLDSGGPNSLLGDGIHQSAVIGQQVYASTVVNTLLDNDLSLPLPGKRTNRFDVHSTNQVTQAAAFKLCNDLVWQTPHSVSAGCTTFTWSSNTAKTPAFGRQSSTTGIQIPSGESVWFGTEQGKELVVVVELNTNSSTYRFGTQGGGAELDTGTFGGGLPGRLSTARVDISGGALGTRPVRFENTGGDPIRLIGAYWIATARSAIYLNRATGAYDSTKVQLVGTWSTAPAYVPFDPATNIGMGTAPYTDTLNDYAVVKFKGDGLMVSVESGKAGGIITVTIDGVDYAPVDTFNAVGSYGFAPILSFSGLAYGNHIAYIKLTGANGSASTPPTDGHRLWLAGIYAVRNGSYVTLNELYS